MNPAANHRAKRSLPGLVIGACLGLVALCLFAHSLETDQHSFNLIPKFEVIGLAFGLIPSSAWGGKQISERIGARNKEALFALLKTSAGIGVFSVFGLTIGSKVGLRMAGSALSFDWSVELGSTLLLVLATFIAVWIGGFLLSWPIHIWLRHKHAAS